MCWTSQRVCDSAVEHRDDPGRIRYCVFACGVQYEMKIELMMLTLVVSRGVGVEVASGVVPGRRRLAAPHLGFGDLLREQHETFEKCVLNFHIMND